MKVVCKPFQGNVFDEYEGKIVSSAKYDPPHSLRMQTGNPEFPFRVIMRKNIHSIDGVLHSFVEPKESIKKVVGSRGDVYTVKTHNGITTCTCPGFQFKKRCKHMESK